MHRIIKNIPNSVTCINLIAGVSAIIFASHGHQFLASLESWQWSAIAIAIAAVADFLDGFCARLLKAYSDLGKQLDSLCDLVSFGVAPTIILFNLLSDSPLFPTWIPWCTLIIPVAAALRLAKFNIDSRQTSSFIGLPVPANAIFWIGYASIMLNNSILSNIWVLLFVILAESWLMVSPLKLFSLKFKTWGFKGNEARWLLIAAAFLFIFTLGLGGLMWLIIFYVSLSMLPFAKSPKNN